MIKAAIFDMDGLLIDSEPFWRQSHIAAIAEYGVVMTEDEAREVMGKRLDEAVQHWRQRHNLQHVPPEALEASISRRVTNDIQQNGEILPGVKALIALLDSHAIPMAVASSSMPEIIEVVLDKLGLKRHMQFAHSAKYEEFGKPHPAVFLTAATRLHIAPADCVVFEDSLSGVRAAKAAGMLCVAVPEIANRTQPEFHSEADLVIPSLEQLDWTILSTLRARG